MKLKKKEEEEAASLFDFQLITENVRKWWLILHNCIYLSKTLTHSLRIQWQWYQHKIELKRANVYNSLKHECITVGEMLFRFQWFRFSCARDTVELHS